MVVIYIFGNRLKKLRVDKDLNQEQLGELIGVTKATISNWENGKGYADGDTLIKLANYFEVTTDYLLGFNTDDINNINALKIALREAGVNDINTVMQLISIFIDENKDKEDK